MFKARESADAALIRVSSRADVDGVVPIQIEIRSRMRCECLFGGVEEATDPRLE